MVNVEAWPAGVTTGLIPWELPFHLITKKILITDQCRIATTHATCIALTVQLHLSRQLAVYTYRFVHTRPKLLKLAPDIGISTNAIVEFRNRFRFSKRVNTTYNFLLLVANLRPFISKNVNQGGLDVVQQLALALGFYATCQFQTSLSL